VPYIPPTLANWPQPYRGIAGLKLHAFNSGYLRLSEALVLRGGSLARTRDLQVPVFLIEHPRHGLVLFNTGLSPKRAKRPATAGEWMSLLRAEELSPGEDLMGQLRREGFEPEAVRWVVLSNLRSEHTGGVKAFPNARVVVAEAEQEHAREQPSGYAPGDLDTVANWKFIDFESAKPLATFPAHVDLFGDGSCLLIDASGATPGTMAMLVRLPLRPVLLADDMAAVRESVRYAAKPAAAYDLGKWWDRVWRLKRLKDLAPEVLVVPGHDLDSIDPGAITVHEFEPPAPAASPTVTSHPLQRLLPKRQSRPQP
jgi:glyoxylase-like metal-dependent hydrolase (beta-lactamase superfamily II)